MTKEQENIEKEEFDKGLRKVNDKTKYVMDYIKSFKTKTDLAKEK